MEGVQNGMGHSGWAKESPRGLTDASLSLSLVDPRVRLQAAFLQALSIDDVDKIALLHRTLVSEVAHLPPTYHYTYVFWFLRISCI